MSEGKRIPLVDVARQFAMVEQEASAAVMRVLKKGDYILGHDLAELEREIASYVGTEEAVGVASGTDALFLPLKALGIGPGDEVITTPFTFFATAEVVANLGAVPRFVDIDPVTFNIDPDHIAAAVNERTRAVIAVHLFGHPADIGACVRICEERGLRLIEDCAQSLGATWEGRKAGSFGTAGALSFFPTKNLGAAGDGGMVLANEGGVADEVRVLRAHGSRSKYHHEALGVNSRLDTVQAALLRVKLRRLDEWNARRQEIASRYDALLEGVLTPVVRPPATHVYHQYTLRSDRRDEIRKSLEDAGIASAVYYPVPLHLQPVFSALGYSEGDLPVSEAACSEVISLPIFPGITDEEIERVARAVNRVSAGG
jgi:dTDP-4-amino-4,6-dideoxygalactose transaminase